MDDCKLCSVYESVQDLTTKQNENKNETIFWQMPLLIVNKKKKLQISTVTKKNKKKTT